MAQGDAILRPTGTLAMAMNDPLAIDAAARTRIGQIGWTDDAFGNYRLFTYRQNIQGSTLSVGGLYSRKKSVITNLDSGTTLTATKAAAFVANEWIGALLIVHDDAGAAGAAPEGECTVIKSNDVNTLNFETDLPLSAALAVNDDVTLISKFVINSADGDFNHVVCGVAMAAVLDDNFGWFQCQGWHARVNHKAAAALVAGDPVVADVATVGPWGADAFNLWVGYNTHTYSVDVASNKGPVALSLMPAFI